MTDKQIISFTKKFRKGVLNGKKSRGMCFAICAPLVTLLNGVGVKCELTRGVCNFIDNDTWQHDWITLQDGRIIDPTSDQFKKPDGSPMPEIYLGEKPEWYDSGKMSNHYLKVSKSR